VEREVTMLRSRAKQLERELEETRRRIRHCERERGRYARDLEWFNDQLVSREHELADARARLAALSEELAELGELRNQLVAAHQQQRRWASAARRIEGSRSWRVGSFLIRVLRLLIRRPAPRNGAAELAASIEAFDRDRGRSLPVEKHRFLEGATDTANLAPARIDNRPSAWSVDFAPLLLQWGITRFRVKRNLGGSSGTNWLVETPSGMHVLRKVIDESAHSTGYRVPAIGTPAEYLQYQVMVMRHLASSDFPYEVPVILTQRNSPSYYVTDGESGWILYRFIEGRRHSQPSAANQARDIGILAGHFDRVLATFDLRTLPGRFPLKLLDIPGTAQQLCAGVRLISTRQDLTGLRKLLLDNIDHMLSAYTAISEPEVEYVRKLETLTIYNDWHPWNIVNRSGVIHGLIDFNSVVEAPRIVDFQNALTWVLSSEKFRPNHEIVTGFTKGYCSVFPLSPLERALVYPVMLDAIGRMVADNLIDETREKGQYQKDGIAIRLTRLFLWLTSRREQITDDLGG
jgi:Ser/Thr protein kinase RdoA (MazF antagonist)